MEDFLNKVKLASENARKEFEEKGQPAIEEFWKSAQKGVQQFGKEISDSIQKEKDRAGRLIDPITGGPPSEAELSQLNICYVSDRVIASSFPVDERLPKRALPKNLPDRVKRNSLAVLSAHLRHNYAGKFMVWNLSEESYDYSAFNNQVMVFSFPGHPSPPLGMLVNICTTIESWLAADSENVALVHCLNGMGRTATILASYLAWIGATSSPQDGLQWVADCKGIPVDKITVPSQRRYLQYFSAILDGQRPADQALVLRRVNMNSVPNFFEVPKLDASQTTDGTGQQPKPICRPYLQLFKNGTLLFSSAPTVESPRPNNNNNNNDLKQKEKATASAGSSSMQDHPPQDAIHPKWIYEGDSSISFCMDFPLYGDILLRGRHVQSNGKRVSMFRIAFHTGYISSGVLRVTKVELDGANVDNRFASDFFLDLVFDVVESRGGPESAVAAAATRQSSSTTTPPRIKKNAGPAKSDAYDDMLLRDVKLWEGIKERKACSHSKAAATTKSSSTPRRSTVPNLQQQSRKPLEDSSSSLTPPPPATSTIINDAIIKQEQENPIPTAHIIKFRIDAEVDEIAANLTDHEATDRDRNLLAELAALEELEIGPDDNGDGDTEANQVALVHGDRVADSDHVAQMTSPMVLKTDDDDGGAATVVDKGKEMGKQQEPLHRSSPSCSSDIAMLAVDSVLNSNELDELEQELSMALSLERSHSSIETRDNSSIAQLDDDDHCTGESENSDIDEDILKELESCLDGIKAGSNTAKG